MTPHYDQPVQAEGVIVRGQRTGKLHLSALDHLDRFELGEVPFLSGDEPWLIRLEEDRHLHVGAVGILDGHWKHSSIKPSNWRHHGGPSPDVPDTTRLTPSSSLGASAQEPRSAAPVPWSDLEHSLLHTGEIVLRTSTADGSVIYVSDNPIRLRRLLKGVDHPMLIFQSQSNPYERRLAASIEKVAEECGVLCASGSGVSQTDPFQPAFTYEMAWVPETVQTILGSLKPSLVEVETHLKLDTKISGSSKHKNSSY